MFQTNFNSNKELTGTTLFELGFQKTDKKKSLKSDLKFAKNILMIQKTLGNSFLKINKP